MKRDETAVRSACAGHYKIAKCRTPQETKNSPGRGWLLDGIFAADDKVESQFRTEPTISPVFAVMREYNHQQKAKGVSFPCLMTRN